MAGQFSSEGKYYVTSDGTLFVYDVHADDRGTYTCKNGISAADKSSARTAKIVVERKLLHIFYPVIFSVTFSAVQGIIIVLVTKKQLRNLYSSISSYVRALKHWNTQFLNCFSNLKMYIEQF